MATMKQQKNSCITCGKTAGMFTCRGCSENFCLQHTHEHRQILEKQMNDIIINHNRLKQQMINQKIDSYHHTLMEQIDQWVQQSIDKIHQTSNEIRQQLVIINRKYNDNIKEKLTQLAQQLTKAQNDGDFFENDLKQWTDILQKVQRTFIEQQNIKIYQVNNVIPLISKISLTEQTNDSINQSINHLKDEISHNQSEIRSNLNMQDEHSSNDHLLRFKLEQYQPNSWVLIGIISKNTSKYADRYNNPTFYGWASNNLVYLHGVAHSNYNNYRSDITKDDIFQLILDYNQQLIRLTNERTHYTYELNVDITKCPFPWEPHIRLLNNFE